MHRLESLQLDNSFARLPGEFYARQSPQALRNAHTVSINPAAAALIDLDPEELQRPDLARYFGGDCPLPGAEPVAMVYAGHQFGVYVPQLGDGRGLLLGEALNARGERWDLHLKGAGQTPYSRSGDGRAVLRSTIREYLCSEAQHALGIPSTRALCIIGSSEPVYREEVEQGATLLRLARTHIRFGHFEFFYYSKRQDLLQQLADYVIDRHYPELRGEADCYRLLFQRVVHSTAQLIGLWQAWGFAHGVMNTDNMSILGETLDYGPFGFLNEYQTDFICNHSDHAGRYSYERQPSVGLWNCAALAQALSPLVPESALKEVLDEYAGQLQQSWLDTMRRRLGLRQKAPQDTQLIAELLQLMQREKKDYHRTLRTLCEFSRKPPRCPLRDEFSDRDSFDRWAGAYAERLAAESGGEEERRTQICDNNPLYVLRNHLAHSAICEAVEKEDYSGLEFLLQLLQRPTVEREGAEEYAAPAPEWSKKLSVSCSS